LRGCTGQGAWCHRPDTRAGRRRDRRLSQRSAAPGCRWPPFGPWTWRKPPGYFSLQRGQALAIRLEPGRPASAAPMSPASAGGTFEV